MKIFRTKQVSRTSPIRLFDNSIIRKSRQGFTLIELLLVVAMIAVIAAAFTTSIAAAERRARISRATAEAKDMTNAILAYEQYAPGRSLSSVAMSSWTDCAEGAMAMILGGAKGASGQPVPVLFNGHVSGGYLRDPWQTPYQYMIVNTATLEGGGGSEMKGVSFKAAAALPNFFRLTDQERR